MHSFGIADEEFIRGHVPMTKAEIRAMVMAKAAIGPHDSVIDIGAGTGSISIEAALCAPQGTIYSIERNPEGIELIQKNAEKFHCSNIKPILGSAPEALEGIPEAQEIIIGGSGGNLKEILDRSDQLLPAGGRIILTAVTVETTAQVMKEFEHRSYRLDAFSMQINRLKKLGHYHLYNPLSPIFIFTAVKF
jgi:cobalt-precorrin-6B (C15)-methyltransferase